MSDWGERNLGEPARRKYGRGAHSIGFTTAARDWDEPAERRQVRPSLAGSYERLFHDVEIEKLLLLLDRATLPDQFDAVIHLDVTSAITPLEPWSIPDADLPETYPVGV
jgi:erythromycin esterase-like protein